MNKIKYYLDKIVEFITVFLFSLMIIITTWQVISRYILKNPSTTSEEFIRFSLIWLSMLAAAYVVGKKSHISITLFSDSLNSQKRKIIDAFIQFSFLIFAIIILIYGGLKAVSLTMGQISPSLNLPMGYVYLALPVSGLLIIIYSIINIINIFQDKRTINSIDEMG
ncbi:TRAP transporter small permease [Pseudogracilibacillus sp. SO10305]|mgnify:CR=1 FL=1|uniref:TRAP transporter small permease n=1 Tax=Pseudogracilibacillus sp. SO10305 TaxID=3098292 RepID=UPI00300E0CF2